jgi:uncharacterized protein YkvS
MGNCSKDTIMDTYKGHIIKLTVVHHTSYHILISVIHEAS